MMATDINEMYDTLSQQYETLKLESQLYQKEITELRQENGVLKEQGEFHRRESSHFTNDTAPLLTHHVAKLSVALEHAELVREESAAENTSYQDIIQELRDENATIKQQNAQYVQTISMLQETHQKQISESDDRIDELQKTIAWLSKENSDILLEMQQKAVDYDALKSSTDTQLMQQMEVSKVKPAIPNDKSLHLKLTNSNTSIKNAKPLTKYSSKPKLEDNDSELLALHLLDRPSNDQKYSRFLQNNPSAASVFSAASDFALVESLSEDEETDLEDTEFMKDTIKNLERKCEIKENVIKKLNEKIERMSHSKRIQENNPPLFSCFSWFS